MKIMMVHVKYRQKGGEDAVFENEVKLLKDGGQNVIPILFSNDEIKDAGIINKLMSGLNAIWSFKYYKIMNDLIIRENPDVVHFHNMFPLLSPSVYKACYDNKTPVIQTLHNYRWGCPAATFYREGSVCELCMSNGLMNSVKYSCYKKSRVITFVVVIMIKFSKWLNIFERYVTKIIVLTDFAKNKMAEAGLPKSKLVVKPNFAFMTDYKSVNSSKNESAYVLFIGRLSGEKGIKFLAESLVKAPKNLCVKVAGQGPDYEEVKAFIEDNDINMELLGSLNKSALSDAIKGCSLVVIPSQWYEGFPMVILDAYSHGKPVLISNIGGLPELVISGKTGEIFELGNINSLRDKLINLMEDQEKLSIMGANAYHKFKNEYSSENNLLRVNELYDDAIRNFHVK